jgi:hypothetical protein
MLRQLRWFFDGAVTHGYCVTILFTSELALGARSFITRVVTVELIKNSALFTVSS